MMNDITLATFRPKRLLFNIGYWSLHQKYFIALLAVSIATFALLFDLNFPRFNDPLISISIIIYCFAIWGILLVMHGLARINIEKAIAIRIVINLSIELSKIRSKEKDRIELRRVSDLLPATSNSFKSGMIRLAEHIIDEAQDRKFESSDVIMRPYKEEVVSDIFKINTIQKIALRLGILGTFMGLLMAFAYLGDFEAIDKNFGIITEALQFSFSTSVAGLEVSVMLALFIILLTREQEKYFKSMEHATQTTIALVRNSINKDAFLVGFDQMKDSLREVQDSVYDQQAETRAQTNAIQDGILKLKDSKNNFDEFLITMAHEMKSVYDILSPEKMCQELRLSMDKAVVGISETLNSKITRHLEKSDQVSLSMEKVSEALKQIEKQLTGQIEFNNDSLNKARDEVYSSVSELSNLQLNYLDQITERHPNQQVEKIFRKIESEFSKQIGQKTKNVLEVITSLENSLKGYSEVIESKVPSFSKKRIVIFSVIGTLIIGLGAMWIVEEKFPGILSSLSQFIESIFG